MIAQSPTQALVKNNMIAQSPTQALVNKMIGNLNKLLVLILNSQRQFNSMKQKDPSQKQSIVSVINTREQLMKFIYKLIKQTLQIEIDCFSQFRLNQHYNNQKILQIIGVKQVVKHQQGSKEQRQQLISVLIYSQTSLNNQLSSSKNTNHNLLNLENLSLLQTNNNKPSFLQTNNNKALLLQTNNKNKPAQRDLASVNPTEKFILQNYFWAIGSSQITPKSIKQLLISDTLLQERYLIKFRQNVHIGQSKIMKVEQKQIQPTNKYNKPMTLKGGIGKQGIPAMSNYVEIGKSPKPTMQQLQCVINSKFIILQLFSFSNTSLSTNLIIPLLSPALQRLKQFITLTSTHEQQKLSKATLQIQAKQVIEYAEWKRRLMSENNSSLIMSNKSIRQEKVNNSIKGQIVKLKVLQSVMEEKLAHQQLLSSEYDLLIESKRNNKRNSFMNISPIKELQSINNNKIQSINSKKIQSINNKIQSMNNNKNKTVPKTNQKLSIFTGLNLFQVISQIQNHKQKHKHKDQQLYTSDQFDLNHSQLIDLGAQRQLQSKIHISTNNSKLMQRNSNDNKDKSNNNSKIMRRNSYDNQDWSSSSQLLQLNKLIKQTFNQQNNQLPQLSQLSAFEIILQRIFNQKADISHKLQTQTHQLQPLNQVSLQAISWLNNLLLKLHIKQPQHNQVILQQKLIDLSKDYSERLSLQLKALNITIREFIQERKWISIEEKLSEGQIQTQLSKFLKIIVVFINSIVEALIKHLFVQYLSTTYIQVHAEIVYANHTNNNQPPIPLISLNPHTIQTTSPFTLRPYPLNHKTSSIPTQIQLLTKVLSQLITQVIFPLHSFTPINQSITTLQSETKLLHEKLKDLYSEIPYDQMKTILEWRDKRVQEELKIKKFKNEAHAKIILFKILVLWGQILVKQTYEDQKPIIRQKEQAVIVQPAIHPLQIIQQIIAGKPQPQPPNKTQPIHHSLTKQQLHRYKPKPHQHHIPTQSISQLQLQFNLSDGYQVDGIDFIDNIQSPDKRQQFYDKQQQYLDFLHKPKKTHSQTQLDLSMVSQISINLSEMEGNKVLRNQHEKQHLSKTNYLYASHINRNKNNDTN